MHITTSFKDRIANDINKKVYVINDSQMNVHKRFNASIRYGTYMFGSE